MIFLNKLMYFLIECYWSYSLCPHENRHGLQAKQNVFQLDRRKDSFTAKLIKD